MLECRLPPGSQPRLNISLSVPSENMSVPVTVTPLAGTSAYQVAFTPPVPAPVLVEGSWGGRPVSGLPASAAVVASVLQPQQWHISSTALNASGGEPHGARQHECRPCWAGSS